MIYESVSPAFLLRVASIEAECRSRTNGMITGASADCGDRPDTLFSDMYKLIVAESQS